MERRDFIKAAGTGMLGASWLAGTWPSSVKGGASVRHSSTSVLKKAVKLNMVEGDRSLLEKFELIKEVGFEGVELKSPGDWSTEEVLRARDKTGLTIHGVLNPGNWRQPLSSPDPEVRARGVATLKAAIEDAAAYGASTVLLVPAVVNQHVAYDEAWRRSQEGIRQVLPVAEARGITIALENVWNRFLLSPMEVARYIDELESPHVGAYLDIGNTLTYGWPEQWMRILGDRVVKLDVKDRSRERYDGRGQAVRVKLGDGDCDWVAVRQVIDEVGYSGWATAEVAGGDAERLREIVQRMDRVLGTSEARPGGR